MRIPIFCNWSQIYTSLDVFSYTVFHYTPPESDFCIFQKCVGMRSSFCGSNILGQKTCNILATFCNIWKKRVYIYDRGGKNVMCMNNFVFLLFSHIIFTTFRQFSDYKPSGFAIFSDPFSSGFAIFSDPFPSESASFSDTISSERPVEPNPRFPRAVSFASPTSSIAAVEILTITFAKKSYINHTLIIYALRYLLPIGQFCLRSG